MIAVALAIYAAILRRYWGGWGVSSNTLKRVIMFAFAVVASFCVYPYPFAAIPAAGIMFAFVMHNHGYGISMGRDGQKTAAQCILAMSAQYGGLSILIAVLMHLAGSGPYIPLGLLVPWCYYVAWKVWDKNEYRVGEFIDGPTAVGELAIGFLLVIGMAFT